MSRLPLGPLGGNSLGDYLREQRQSARLSLRQLSELAGVSNPYLSQIERGLKKPSAEILQQLAKGLEVSAESLYVRAGILDERPQPDAEGTDTRAAISADPRLTARQRAALLDIYDSFVGAASAVADPEMTPAERATVARKVASAARATTASQTAAGTATARRAAAARNAAAARGGVAAEGDDRVTASSADSSSTSTSTSRSGSAAARQTDPKAPRRTSRSRTASGAADQTSK